MALGTLVQFRLVWAVARSPPGTVLRQHPNAEDCSADGVCHLAIHPLFVFERETQKPARVPRLSSMRRVLPERSDRPSQLASPYALLEGLLASCSKLQLWKCAGQKIAACDPEGKAMRYSCMPCNPVAVGVTSTTRPNLRTVGLLHSSCLVVASSTKVSCGRKRARMTKTSRNGIGASKSRAISVSHRAHALWVPLPTRCQLWLTSHMCAGRYDLLRAKHHSKAHLQRINCT